jgi:uncharacterized membrane protein YhaH (DUF805 family)
MASSEVFLLLHYTHMKPDHASPQSYIETQRQSGIADATIYQNLVASGWPEATIQQYLNPTPQAFDSNASQPAVNPSQPLDATPPTEQTGFFKGRLGRLGFLMAAVYVVAYFSIATVLALVDRSSRVITILVILMGIFGVLTTLPISISMHIRRWHDLDQSGWLTLLDLIPLIGLLASILLLILPGTPGPNRYGPAHPKSLSPKTIFGFSK